MISPNIARKYCRQTKQVNTIQIGRSRNAASAGNNTPVKYIEGNSAPQLQGQPYLKTSFRRKGFHKILYTHSTLSVVVGKNWCLTN